MPTQWPSGPITFPFSGILTGFVVHPYHVGDLYLELSGVETSLLTGYWNFSSGIVRGPLVFTNGATPILTMKIAATAESGYLTSTDWNTFNNKQLALGFWPLNSVLSGNVTTSTSGNISIGSATSPLSGIYSNQYETTVLSGAVGGPTTAYTVNWNLGSSQILNFNPGFSGNIYISFLNPIAGSTYALQTIQNPSGSSNAYFNTSAKWAGGTSGTMTTSGNAIDLFAFYWDGTRYLSTATQNFK